MDISVIIINYNVKHFLEHCLHSVFNASKNLEVEVFVVDNNSVDGSTLMLREKFPGVKRIENKINYGFAKANNQAIKQAKGKYILILNPDTVIEEKTLDSCYSFMEDHEEAGITGVKMIDGKGNYLPESKRALPTPSVAFYKIFGLSALFPKSRRFGRYHLGFLDKDEINPVNVLPGAFMFIRKQVLDKVGYFDETFFMYGEDIDLSYRVNMAGYKNYYYPKTTIIHYKGESTKKGSINYVMLFYNAMIIFAKKHFSSPNAYFLSILIHSAIYIRAGLSIIRRLIITSINPLLNALMIFLGYWLFLPFWENYVFQKNGFYPDTYLKFVVPSYILIWLISLYLSGAFEKHIRTGNIIRGVLLGSLSILIIYALLPEHLRFSRALIVLGTIWTLMSTFSTRILLSVIDNANFRFEIIRHIKRMLIIGDQAESQRVYSIVKQTQVKPELVGIVNPDTNGDNTGYIGNLSQIVEIVSINKIDEVIFCAKSMPSQIIIGNMLKLTGTDVDFKIAPPESLSIIGSNSINTAGDLYTVSVNSISKGINKRKKRLFDFLTAVLLLLLTPVTVWFISNPFRMVANILKVIAGKLTFVGYKAGDHSVAEKLPPLRPGILTPMEALNREITDTSMIDKINMIYAKDYKMINDMNIVVKGFTKLGRKRA